MAAAMAEPPYQQPHLHPPTTASRSGIAVHGRYQLGRILGRGSFAKVYRARSLKDNKPVAIKVIDKLKTDPSTYHRIVGVVAAMRRLDHPNVLKIHEVTTSRTKIYLVTELAKGGNLFEKLSRHANCRFPEPLARRYFGQIVSALGYCHRNGVAHCDVKLQNIFLDDEGNIKVRPKLDHLLRTERGTMAFAGPEVVGRARAGYDGFKADAWSCGVILFVLLTGYLPFDDSNLVKMYRKMRMYDFRFPAWVSKPARGLITRLLDPNPKTRLSIKGIMKDGWFKNRELVYNPRSVTLGEMTPLEEKKGKKMERGLEAKTSMNEIEIMSMSSRLNLLGMLKMVDGKGAGRREKRPNGSGSSLGSGLRMSSWVGLRKGVVVLSVVVAEVAAKVVHDGGLGWEEEELGWGELKLGWAWLT